MSTSMGGTGGYDFPSALPAHLPAAQGHSSVRTLGTGQAHPGPPSPGSQGHYLPWGCPAGRCWCWWQSDRYIWCPRAGGAHPTLEGRWEQRLNTAPWHRPQPHLNYFKSLLPLSFCHLGLKQPAPSLWDAWAVHSPVRTGDKEKPSS